MYDIKQFIPQDVCLKCEGCCRFREKNSVWQPSILNVEVKLIAKDDNSKDAISPSKKINTLPFKDYYNCFFFDIENNGCKIYKNRPLECRLYPFLINKTKDTTYLSVDLKCPFIQDKLDKKEFKDYLNYLISFLSLPVVSFAIKQNPHIFIDYTQEEKLKNLAILVL